MDKRRGAPTQAAGGEDESPPAALFSLYRSGLPQAPARDKGNTPGKGGGKRKIPL